MAFLYALMPNVITYREKFFESILETLQMVSISFVFVVLFGLLLGVLLAVVSKGHLYENRFLDAVIPKIVNVVRAIPFVILLTLLIPFTRALVGTAIGVRGALVPLVVSMVPFVSRQVELSVLEVDYSVIEMGLSMGYSRPYIIVNILLREARGGIIRSIITSSISLVNVTTMAGVVGGGGIGDFAIRYGYTRFMTDITVTSVIVLLIIVFGIQGIGNLILKKISHD